MPKQSATRGQMSRLINLINDQRRRRQAGYDPISVILHIFIDPKTKKESTNTPRLARVVGGPDLWQEPNESNEIFDARVDAAVSAIVGNSDKQIN